MQHIENKKDLIKFFEVSEKPKSQWRIGAEHELFLYNTKTLQRASAQEIQTLLRAWADAPEIIIFEGVNPIGVNLKNATISLEPGGQFELSGAPYACLYQVTQESTQHASRLKEVAATLNLFPVSLGYDPYTHVAQAPWMPKARYGVMRPYMTTKGTHGLEMMANTCTVQVNLDYASESDMVRKFRVALALQPLATALFSNSPLTQGAVNGYQSYRRFIWHHTDSDRCGTPAFVFEDGMGYERYVDYALDVPMYFVKRDDRYINVAGQSFRDFMEGRLRGLPSELPTLKDWEDHLTTIFTEVRLKRILEMRGADSGPLPHLCALPAFWVGLLYNEDALSACEELIKSWTFEDILKATQDVPVQGLNTILQGQDFWHIAKDVLMHAYHGLQCWQAWPGEIHPLDHLTHILESRTTQAMKTLEIFQQYPDKADFLREIS